MAGINADYDVNVETRSMILLKIEELGFVVPYETFEGSDDVVKWLTKFLLSPSECPRKAV